MAKGSKKRKQPSENSTAVLKKPRKDVVEPLVQELENPTLIGNLIFQDELETTTETLSILSKNPALIGLKALKPFKTAVHDYWRVAHETSNTGACACRPKNNLELMLVQEVL
jgi:hypothetical protein